MKREPKRGGPPRRTPRKGPGGAPAAPAGTGADARCASASCGCGEGAGDPGTSRREFLKVVGITGAGAATFGCKPPDMADKLIPYLVQEEELTPGVSSTYATTLTGAGGEPLGVHADVRDGRVIKLEGNPDFPTNRGRLSSLAHSELQALYDPDRLKGPRRRRSERGAGEGEEARRADGEQAPPANG
ncbi:MAG: twin-arginine translocation signal domain-containing protein, partial [Gemmatimonadota bacterium]